MVLLSESFLKPLFGIYDKYKVGIGIKGKSGKFKEKIRYINYFDNVKLKLTNKRSVFTSRRNYYILSNKRK
jgi:hypothetical protein